MDDMAQNMGRCFDILVARVRDCKQLWSSNKQADEAVLKTLMSQVWLLDAASHVELVNGQRRNPAR